MSQQINRTIDIQFEFIDVQNIITGNVCETHTPCPCENDKKIDVSLSDVSVEVDLIQYNPSDYEMQVILGQMLKGDKGDPGYTPQRGIDYWTDDDIALIDEHTETYVDSKMMYWEAL